MCFYFKSSKKFCFFVEELCWVVKICLYIYGVKVFCIICDLEDSFSLMIL